MKISWLVLCGVLLTATAAHADCAGKADSTATVTLSKINALVYDGKGKKLKGCLLESEDHVLGYTTDDALCHTRLGDKVDVRLSYGCCDTGPDHGDKECVVRSKTFLGVTTAHGNGVMVHPAETAAPQ